MTTRTELTPEQAKELCGDDLFRHLRREAQATGQTKGRRVQDGPVVWAKPAPLLPGQPRSTKPSILWFTTP